MMRRVGRTQARIAQMLLTLVFVMIPFANKPAQAEVKPLTVTINGGESLGVTPVSTAVPEALSVNVEGEPETTPDVPNAGPTYAWTLVEAKYRAAANGQWENVSPAHGSVTLTPDGLPSEAENVTVETNFAQPGFYRFKVKVAVDWSIGTGEDTWFGEDEIVITQTVFRVNISIAGLTEEQDETPGASVALNDDFDNGQLSTYSYSNGYHIGEPIMDLVRNQNTPQENDLLPVTLSVEPSGLAGQAQLTGGGASIYLWPAPGKGTLSQIIDTPKTYNLNELPKTLYVEGKFAQLGSTSLTLSCTMGGGTHSDTLNINVVTLVEHQDGERRVINNYDEEVEFEVIGGSDACEYRWDLNGDGDRAADVFEQGVSNRSRSVSYGPAENATTVALPLDAAHRRQDYNVSVQLIGGLVLTRPIHVALDAFYGTPLTGATVAERQVEVATLGDAVGTFDPLPTTGDHSQSWFETDYGVTLDIDNNRLQYAPRGGGNANALTFYDSAAGNGRRVFAVLVTRNPYDTLPIQVGEDVTATINHENRHVDQHSAVRDNVRTGERAVWRLLDDYFGRQGANVAAYSDFREAQGHWSEVNNSDVGWYHLSGLRQNDVPTFHTRYNAALGIHVNMSDAIADDITAKNAARTFLQGLYGNLPSDLVQQMKTYGWINHYDYYARAPE